MYCNGLFAPNDDLILGSLCTTRYLLKITVNVFVLTRAQELPQSNPLFALPKNRPQVVLSGEWPFLDMEGIVSTFKGHNIRPCHQ